MSYNLILSNVALSYGFCFHIFLNSKVLALQYN
jgi:hypothetical protein